jgi:hypothetical protein
MVQLGVLHSQGGMLLAFFAGFQGFVARAGAIQEIQGLAGGDGDELGSEAGFKAEAGEGPVSPEKGLLNDVIGIQVVLDDGEGLAIDIPLKALHQQAESRLVTGLGRLDPGQDFWGMVGGSAQHAGFISYLRYHGSCSMVGQAGYIHGSCSKG